MYAILRGRGDELGPDLVLGSNLRRLLIDPPGRLLAGRTAGEGSTSALLLVWLGCFFDYASRPYQMDYLSCLIDKCPSPMGHQQDNSHVHYEVHAKEYFNPRGPGEHDELRPQSLASQLGRDVVRFDGLLAEMPIRQGVGCTWGTVTHELVCLRWRLGLVTLRGFLVGSGLPAVFFPVPVLVAIRASGLMLFLALSCFAAACLRPGLLRPLRF